jgi:hypothetical protein
LQRQIVLALADGAQQTLLADALEVLLQGVSVQRVAPSAHIESAALQAMRGAQPPVLIVDIAALAQLRSGVASFCAWTREQCQDATLLLYCSTLHVVLAQARTWAQRLGARDLLPGCDTAHWRSSLLPTLDTILAAAGVNFGANTANVLATQHAALSLGVTASDNSPITCAWQQTGALRNFNFESDEIIALMSGAGGLDIRTRTYHAISYTDCFVGKDAVDWLSHHLYISRDEALRVGQALLDLGHIYHVTHEQPFQDGHFFYRVRANTAKLNALDLQHVVALMRSGGLAIEDRAHRGTPYPACFVGTQAVAWMRETLGLNQSEALSLGQRLVNLHLVHHVLDQHPMRNGNYFYRFYEDET